jgi:hypothetical protein
MEGSTDYDSVLVGDEEFLHSNGTWRHNGDDQTTVLVSNLVRMSLDKWLDQKVCRFTFPNSIRFSFAIYSKNLISFDSFLSFKTVCMYIYMYLPC